MTPEHKIWARYLEIMIDDAMGMFHIPNPEADSDKYKDLDTQYKKIVKDFKKRKNFSLNKREQLHKKVPSNPQATLKARAFLESSQFDEIACDLGYGSLLVNKTFALVQEAITLEKKLWERFKVT